MLAAMMAQGARFANRHDLSGGVFTVPSGVTTIWVVAAAKGGAAGPNTVQSGGNPGGGGGGGAAVLFVPFTVAAGEKYQVIAQGQSGFPTDSTLWTVRLQTLPNTLLCSVVEGFPAFGGDNRGGGGGRVQFGTQYSFAFLEGGLQGSAASGDGPDGSSGAFGDGVAMSGGGGGGGGAYSPVTLGGNGGAGGPYAGETGTTVYGGNGGGFNPGSRRLDASTVTNPGANRFEVYW
jgi:hypothetical protein